MIDNPKKDCPHIEKVNLEDLEKCKKISFESLKCQKCDESKELLVCLICGDIFCSKNVKNHFDDHNRENQDHCLYLGITDLSIWCNNCINNKQGDQNKKGAYIESEMINKYLEIIYKEEKDFEKTKNKKDEAKIELNLKEQKELCSHVKDEVIINRLNGTHDTFFNSNFKVLKLFKDKAKVSGICLICGNIIVNLK